MSNATFKNVFSVILAGVAITATGSSAAEGGAPIPTLKDELHFTITPYLWAAGISGSVSHNNAQLAHTHISSDKVLSNLSVGGMIDGEAHYGRYGLLGNAVFAKLSNQSSKSAELQNGLTATVDSNASSWLGVYTLAGTYTAYTSKSLYIDLLAGARWLNLNAKVDLSASVADLGYTGARTLYSSLHATDAIGGLKGRARISDSSFFVPFYLDAGGGSATAKFTSQQAIGIGYAMKDLDLALYYNNLYYSLNNGGNVSSYVNMTGPALAATFKF